MNTVISEQGQKNQALQQLAVRYQGRQTRAIIAQHIVRLENGLGDVKAIGGGVRELRIDVGPGWRVYFIEVEGYAIVLLVGGNKSTQTADIKKTRQMVKELKKSAAAKSTVNPKN